MQGGVQVRWVGQVRVVPVQGVRVGIALEHAEEAVREQRGGLVKVMLGMETMRWQLGRKEHRIAVECRGAGQHVRVLCCLQVAEVQRELLVLNRGR